MSLLKTFKFKVLFFAIYLFATLVSFFFIGASFVFAHEVKLENMLILGVMVTLGFLTPLVASNFYIENWKNEIANPTVKSMRGKSEKTTIINFFTSSIQLFVLLVTLIITASSAVICGTLFTKYFSFIESFSPIVVGFPALLLGIGSFWILSKLADLIILKLEK